MQRFIISMAAIFICGTTIAQTINWYVDNQVYQTTTCSSGESITPPAAPTKYGYTFQRWGTYAQLEYIKGNNSARINTGVIFNSGTLKYKTKIYMESVVSGEHDYIGNYNGSNGFINGTIGDSLFMWAGGNGVRHAYETSTWYNIECTISQSTTNCTINDSFSMTYNNVNNVFTNTPIYILANGPDYWPWGSEQRIGPFSIWINDILVRDFIPVLDPYGVPYMYDKVEGRVYYDQGAGQFIAGPILGE